MGVFDQLAEKYRGDHSGNPFQAALTERISSLLPAGASVLDLGCGTGIPPRRSFTGLADDFGRFEPVTAFFSLLMPSKADIEKTLTKVAGWLKPGGYLGIGMVNFDGDRLPFEFLGVPVTVSGYLEPDLAAVLKAHGFTVTSIETVDFVPEGGPAESQIFALAQLEA